MTSDSVWLIIKALATTLDASHERLPQLENEITGMGPNQREALARDFATIISGLHRLHGATEET